MFGYLNLLAGGRFPADAGHWTGNHISVVLVGPYTEKKIIICQCLFAVITNYNHRDPVLWILFRIRLQGFDDQ
jgi:hypothetical protein